MKRGASQSSLHNENAAYRKKSRALNFRAVFLLICCLLPPLYPFVMIFFTSCRHIFWICANFAFLIYKQGRFVKIFFFLLGAERLCKLREEQTQMTGVALSRDVIFASVI